MALEDLDFSQGRKLTELLGLTAIYSVTVGSSSRLLGPSSQCWVFFKRKCNMKDPTFMYVRIDRGQPDDTKESSVTFLEIFR